MTASSNKVLAQPGEATNALERLIRDYGYAGYLSPQSTKPSAVMFGKTPVQPYARGGKVRFTDDPDVQGMVVHMAKGGDKPKAVARGLKEAAQAAKDLKKERDKVAKQILKDNPNIKPEVLEKRASDIAESNIKWRTQEKPLGAAAWLMPFSQHHRSSVSASHLFSSSLVLRFSLLGAAWSACCRVAQEPLLLLLRSHSHSTIRGALSHRNSVSVMNT